MRKYHFLIIPLFALAFLLVSCGGSAPGTNDANSSSAPSTNIGFDGTILTGKHTVILHTNKGDITVELDADAAPKTVTNFVALAKAGYYNGLTFHRVFPGFMIQGGDPTGTGQGGASVFGATFDDEINADSYDLGKQTIEEIANGQALPPGIDPKLTLKQYYESQGYHYTTSVNSLPLTRGAIAMANRGPNTNGSQFFIIQADATPWLNGKHTVFGHVTTGLSVVDGIAQTERDSNDKPLTPVTFTVEVVN